MVDNIYLKNVLSKYNPEVIVTSADRLSETECQNSNKIDLYLYSNKIDLYLYFVYDLL